MADDSGATIFRSVVLLESEACEGEEGESSRVTTVRTEVEESEQGSGRFRRCGAHAETNFRILVFGNERCQRPSRSRPKKRSEILDWSVLSVRVA